MISVNRTAVLSCRVIEQNKKGYDQARGRTRVNIGEAFQRWTELKEREGLELDAEVALFLLDRWVTLILRK
uniref:Uncharacterized protein n=1 Tax=Cyprinus carpio TaxID=7962 RepID=A0A8C1WFA9_CYPCA